jgi:hypothetical protein
MTQTRTAQILSTLTALLVLSGIGAFMVVALTAQLGRASQVPASHGGFTPAMHRIDAIPPVVDTSTPIPGTGVLPAETDELAAAVFGGGEIYTTTQDIEIHEAADRVCEGFTAGVPMVVMEPEIAREFGLDGQAAHDFVRVAHEIQCPLA